MPTPPSESEFPALCRLPAQDRYPLRDAESLLVGRSPDANVVLLDATCSRRQFRIVRRGPQCVLEPLSANVETRCDGQVVRGPTPLSHGALIEAGASRFRFLEHEDSALARRDASAASPAPVASPSPSAAAQMRTIVGTGAARESAIAPVRPIPLAGQVLIGRDPDRVDVVLPHARVSRIHARITSRQGTAVLSDLASANGTFVNGRRVLRPTALRPQDRIDIGPYGLLFDGRCLSPVSRIDNVELAARNLTRVVRDRKTRGSLTLLDDISLVVRPREFVCLLGPSGSGKTTLLSALSARAPAERGRVTINGQDFYANFDMLKQDVAVVPQNVAFHDLLPLRSALLYTARLRLPPDTSEAERIAAVSEMLAAVGLSDCQETRIRDLSGGQAKRASLANEILSRPGLLFLDEVTSGLDEQTDREMMKLFRGIADNGKTVVCVTHNSANVEAYATLVVVLAFGGRLAFVGSPAETLQYFGVNRLGDIYDRLHQRDAGEWKQAFLRHSFYCRYVDSRLPAESDADAPDEPRTTGVPPPRLTSFVRQGGILANRYLQLQIADLRSLATMLAQCFLVAMLLIVFYGDLDLLALPEKARNSGKILFLLTISCLWFGCNNAAREIVKERTIYLRERSVNLLIPSYYASKLLMGAWCVVQATVLLSMVKQFTNLPGDYLAQWVFLAILSLVGVAMGLLISAAARTNDSAVGMVPAALLPQIILAGVIAPVKGLAETLARGFIGAYWGYRGLAGLLPHEISALLGADEWSATNAFCVLVLHFCAFILLAVGALVLADPSARVSIGKALRSRADLGCSNRQV